MHLKNKTEELNEMDQYFSGKKLYGNDFDSEQIKQWFNDEKEAYSSLGKGTKSNGGYGYHLLNQQTLLKHLPDKHFDRVLGFGSAHGQEFVPILDKIGHLTILEPSEKFIRNHIGNVPVEYHQPSADGTFEYEENTFDLILCISVLHHIPNVSTIIKEFARCCRPGGYVLIREPITSMGDWRKPRSGLTKHERGIPLNILERMILDCGLRIINRQKCMFSLTSRWRYLTKNAPYNSGIAMFFDRILCAAFCWNSVYHAKTPFQKFRPTSASYVLQKPS